MLCLVNFITVTENFLFMVVNITCADMPCRADQECVDVPKSCPLNATVCIQYKCIDHRTQNQNLLFSQNRSFVTLVL
jgi:hypothetical protein